MAGLTEDPENRRKLEVLRLLETKTKEACVGAMVRNGLSTDPDPKTVTDAEGLAEVAATIPWSDFMAAFELITTQFIFLYERIGEVSPR